VSDRSIVVAGAQGSPDLIGAFAGQRQVTKKRARHAGPPWSRRPAYGLWPAQTPRTWARSNWSVLGLASRRCAA